MSGEQEKGIAERLQALFAEHRGKPVSRAFTHGLLGLLGRAASEAEQMRKLGDGLADALAVLRERQEGLATLKDVEGARAVSKIGAAIRDLIELRCLVLSDVVIDIETGGGPENTLGAAYLDMILIKREITRERKAERRAAAIKGWETRRRRSQPPSGETA